MQSSTVIRSQSLQGEVSANISDLDCTPSVSLRRAWAEVCRWIASLAGGSSRWGEGQKNWSHGAQDIQHPHRHKLRENGAQASVHVQSHVLSVPVRPSEDPDDDLS